MNTRYYVSSSVLDTLETTVLVYNNRGITRHYQEGDVLKSCVAPSELGPVYPEITYHQYIMWRCWGEPINK